MAPESEHLTCLPFQFLCSHLSSVCPELPARAARLCAALGCVFFVSKQWIIIGATQLMYSEVSERNLGLLAAVSASFAFHLQDFYSINEECYILSKTNPFPLFDQLPARYLDC